jgi:2-polyprenyl-6-methoxyphenol hydroxylase-like FAD-dependent oxidoreductase
VSEPIMTGAARRVEVEVAVVGGGIGGLAVALSLHERGFQVAVFEQADAVRELGVGLNVLPPAVGVLTDLGLLDALDNAAIRTRELIMTTRPGDVVWREPRGTDAGHPVPQFSIHRGRLQGILADALRRRAGAHVVRVSHRLRDFEQDGDGVRATFVDRDGCPCTTVDTAALIGADGIHSTVRRQLQPHEGPPRWNGAMMWRGATPWEQFLDGRTMIIAGGMSGKIVVYPIAPGPTASTRLTNWGVVAPIAEPGTTPPRREDWSRLGRREDLEPQLAALTIDVVDVEPLAAATAQIFEYPMCDRDPLARWSHGRVTLLGDAAHPMFPMGSNGATQAIVDGRSLVGHLAGAEPVEALERYDQERRPATTRLVTLNRIGGPERVIDVVERLAPDGFAHIDDVVTPEALRAIVDDYASATGIVRG